MNSPIPSLRNGLTLAFAGLWSERLASGEISVTDFTVTLGGMLAVDASELAEISLPIYREIKAVALEVAREENAAEMREMEERKSWFSRQ